MEGLGEFICQNCNMVFHCAGLLDKHKAKFCIGTDLKDPIALWKGQRLFTREREKAPVKTVHPTRARTPDLIILKEQRKWQVDQRQSEQSKPQDKVSDKFALNKLTEEFQKLRMSVEHSLSRKQNEVSEEQRLPHHRADVQRTLDLQKDHQQRLAEIRAHNQQLEKERQEIEMRLAELAGREKTAHLEEVLQELRSQEQRNRNRGAPSAQLSSHISSEKRPNSNEAPSSPPEEKKTQHVTCDLISSVDGPLSAQIRALRVAYMKSGGSDPEVLAHMHDLQAEAFTLEQTRSRAEDKTRARRMKSPRRVFDSDVLALEQENQRLEEEIFRIQLARERHKREHGFTDIQKDHIRQMASLQAEIAFLMKEIERGRERRPVHPQPPLPDFSGSSMALTSPALPLDETPGYSLACSYLNDPTEALDPPPCDPVTGFVIFYDLVIGIEDTLRLVRLLAGLYCNGQRLGEITPMPPVQCQPALSLPSKSPGNYAILAVKQPVPSVQSSPNLSLIMEIQASRGLDLHKNELEGLVTCGWARFELFDQHNQVHSGSWRIPIHSLPAQASPGLSPDCLSSVPQLGNMEVCLRVANTHDRDVQTLVKIDPNNTSQYKYTSMVSDSSVTQKPNHSSNSLPSSWSQTSCGGAQLDMINSM